VSARDVLDPAETYLYLADGGAVERLDLDGSFWEDLTSGKLDLDQGRLMMATDMSRNMEHWEMHPDGEEILVAQSGAFDIIIEGDLGEPVRLDPERPATVIPRGVWHRINVVEDGRLLFITYGRGTEHKELVA
jgi:mannose-6-phosphate isomerase-like protein (cupin superfamily)